MARKNKKIMKIELTPYHELLSKVRRGGRPDQTFRDRKKEANRRKCRGKVRDEN